MDHRILQIIGSMILYEEVDDQYEEQDDDMFDGDI